MVLVEGIEPTRPCGHRILSPARLPVPPHQPRFPQVSMRQDVLQQGAFLASGSV